MTEVISVLMVLVGLAFLLQVVLERVKTIKGNADFSDSLITDLGKFLDPIADKMLINSMMVFLALNFVSLTNNLKFSFFLVIIMIVRDLIVDGLRFMVAKKNVVVAANIFGKLKTVTQMLAIIVVFLNGFPFSYFDYNWPIYLHIGDWLCYIATFFSVLSGVIYVKQNIKYIL